MNRFRRSLAVSVLLPLLALGLAACAEAPKSGKQCSATHRTSLGDWLQQATANVAYYEWISGKKLKPEQAQDAVMKEAIRLWGLRMGTEGEVVGHDEIQLQAALTKDDDWEDLRDLGVESNCYNGKWSYYTAGSGGTTTTTTPLGSPVSFTLPLQKMIYNPRPWNGVFTDHDLDRCVTQIIDPSMQLYPGSTVTVLAYACEDVYEYTTRLYVYAFPNRTATTPADFNGATEAYPLTSLKVTATQAGEPVATFDGAPTGSWTTWNWNTGLSVRDGAITFKITSLTHAASKTTG